MSKEKVKQYVFLTILMSVINFCVAGVLIGTTVINLKGAEAAEENIQQLNQQIAVIDQETEKQTEKQTEILVKETSKSLPFHQKKVKRKKRRKVKQTQKVTVNKEVIRKQQRRCGIWIWIPW